ncbi:hypothetical protein [Hymenobacter lapidarius]|nr:hypothetical protein [Hymenobacter lapidarius]
MLQTACQQSEQATDLRKSQLASPTEQYIEAQRTDTDVLTESTIKKLVLGPSLHHWEKLDSLACLTGGESTGNMGLATVKLWELQFQSFVTYLTQHPKSCLRQSLVWGMSEEQSVLKGTARAVALAAFKKEVSQRAAMAGLTQAEQQYCKLIMADVKPELYD